MIFRKKVQEVDRENRKLSAEFMFKLNELSSFDTKEHKWVEEIGEFNNQTHEFKVSDEKVKQNLKDEVRVNRILMERELYRELQELKPISFEANDYRDEDERWEILLQAARYHAFGFTEAEICHMFEGLSSSYLRANRSEYRKAKMEYKKRYEKQTH